LLALLSRSEMLDPLTALSVSCSVLQIVDFAGGLVSKTKEYYDNGFLIDHKDYAAAATKLEALTKELEKSISKKSTQPTSEEIALRNITLECRDVAGDFISVLNDLKVEDKHHAWKSFYQAFKTVWSKDRIDAMLAKLHSLREQMMLPLLLVIRFASRALFCESH
jgi:hypothetical protein